MILSKIIFSHPRMKSWFKKIILLCSKIWSFCSIPLIHWLFFYNNIYTFLKNFSVKSIKIKSSTKPAIKSSGPYLHFFPILDFCSKRQMVLYLLPAFFPRFTIMYPKKWVYAIFCNILFCYIVTFYFLPWKIRIYFFTILTTFPSHSFLNILMSLF